MEMELLYKEREMKRFKAEQEQKSCNLRDNCVGLHTDALLGGGAI